MKIPLHELIRSDFETKIIAGELQPGDRLPIENDIMKQYDCSRMTVNKALSALNASGLISRRKKAGTFVAQPRVHSMVLDVPDLPAQLRERGQTHDYSLLFRTERLPDRKVEAEASLVNGGLVLELQGLHRADLRPIAVERRLVAINVVPGIVSVDFQKVTPGTWLLQHVPWTEAENRISATGADEQEARILGIAPGAPCLCVERHTWRADETVTYVRQLFVADAYDMVARFGPAVNVGS